VNNARPFIIEFLPPLPFFAVLVISAFLSSSSRAAYFANFLFSFQAKKDSLVTGVKSSDLRAALSASIFSSIVVSSAAAASASFLFFSLSFLEVTT
jgi:hypothetical protein